jgi:hypothetical protein
MRTLGRKLSELRFFCVACVAICPVMTYVRDIEAEFSRANDDSW